ncbi:hypothetical protein Tco_1575865 [Tanacetum coccineum]
MWYSITKGPYVRPMIPDPDDPRNQIPEPLSKMTKANRKRYTGDCLNAQELYLQLITNNDAIYIQGICLQYAQTNAKEGESLDSVYERLSTLVNVMDRNDVFPLKESINTKFLYSLQPEWSKYVTLTRQNKDLSDVKYDSLYDTLLEQMLLAMKDAAGGTLNEEENDFMLDNAYGDETLEELTAAVIMMARIQPADENTKTEPKYDAEAISEVNASHIDLISGMISKGVHEHTNHEKHKIVINISNDDQIDYNIIFDDPYVENNGGTVEHDSNAHD